MMTVLLFGELAGITRNNWYIQMETSTAYRFPFI
jgi:hypothetical protein